MATREEVIFKVSADLQGFKKSMDQLKKIAEESSKKIEKSMDMNLTDEGSRAGKTFSNGINNQMKSVTNTIKNELKRVAEQASEIEINASLSKSAIDNIKQQLSDVEDNILTATDRSSASMSNNANAPNNNDNISLDTKELEESLGRMASRMHSVIDSVRVEISKTLNYIVSKSEEASERVRSNLEDITPTKGLQRFSKALNDLITNTRRAVFKVGDVLKNVPMFEGLGNKIQHFSKETMEGLNKIVPAAVRVAYSISKIPASLRSMYSSIKSIRNIESACNVVGRGFIRLGTRVAQTEMKIKRAFNLKHATHFGSTIGHLGVKIQKLGQEGGKLRKLSDNIKKVVDSAKNTNIFKKMANWIKGAGDEAEKSSKKMKLLSGSLKSLIGYFTAMFGIYQLFSILKEGTQDAIKYEAAIMNLQRTLGKASTTLTDFANTNAQSFGISKMQVAEYGNIFSVLLMNVNKGMAKAGDTMDDVAAKTAEMSKGILEAAGIISGALGYDTATVLENLRSGILGSSEAVDQYGLSLKIANLEQSRTFQQVANGASSWNDLTVAQQQYIIAQEIINQTTANYGKIVKNTASMQNSYNAQLANTKLALGNVGKAIWTAMLPALTKIMAVLEVVFNYVAKVMSAILGLFGIKVNFSEGGGTSGALDGLGGGLDNVSDSAGGASDALGDAADAAKGAGSAAKDAAKDTEKAAKDIKRALAGFDQINVLSLGKDSDSTDPGGGSGGGGGGGGTGGGGGGGGTGGGGGGNLNGALTDVELEMDDTLSGIAESIMNWVKSIDFGPLIESFNRLKESIQPIIETCGKLVMWFLTDVLAPLAKFTIEEIIPRFFDTLSNILRILAPILDAAVDAFITFNNAVLIPIAKWTAGVFLEVWDAINNVLKAFGDWLNGDGAWCAEILGTLAGSLAVVGEVFLVVVAAIKTGVAIFNGITTAIELAGAAFSFITSPIGLTIAAITAVVAAVVLCIQHWDEIKEAMGPVWDVIKDVWDKIAAAATELYEEHIKPLGKEFADLAKAIWDAAKKIWNESIKPLWDAIKPFFTWLINTFIKNTEAKFKLFGEVIALAFDVVMIAVETLFDLFGDLLDIITGLIEFVTGVFTGDWDKAWNGVKKIVSGVVSAIGDLFKGLWEIIKTVFKPVTDWFKQKFEAAKDAVEKAWSKVCDFFKKIWEGIKKIFDPSTYFGKAFADGKEETEKPWKKTPKFFEDIWKGITDAFGDVKKWFSDKFGKAVDAVEKLFDDAKDWSLPKPKILWEDIKDTAKKHIDAAKEKVTSFTANLPKPNVLWESIKDTAKKHVDAAKEKVTNCISSLPKPSVLWDSIKDTAKSFVDKAKEKVTSCTSSLPKPSVSWDSIKDTAKSFVDKAKEKVTSCTSSLPKPSVSWSSIATTAKDYVDKAKAKVTSCTSSLPKPSVSWSSLATSAKSAVDAAKKKVTGFSASLPKPSVSWSSVTTAVSTAISNIKKKMNFSWSLPKPKTPKFTAQWKTVFGVKIPSGFSISWHAKGGIMTKPTIFGINGNNLLAGGEAGHEAVLPLEKLWNQLANQFSKQNAILSNTVASVGSGSSGPVNITLKINDIEMGKAVVNSLKALSDHSGEIDLPL